MNVKHQANVGKWIGRMLCAALLSVGVVGCEREGPAEQAGEKLDNAARDAGNAVEDKCEQTKEAAGAADTRC
jgi:hypothetical protein